MVVSRSPALANLRRYVLLVLLFVPDARVSPRTRSREWVAGEVRILCKNISESVKLKR